MNISVVLVIISIVLLNTTLVLVKTTVVLLIARIVLVNQIWKNVTSSNVGVKKFYLK